ncbi:hypothetical protein FZC75_09175 [Sutcliffiella horikoshii]|uniref:Uncharacterized protein n=1 Tax=Sutcliffiella horikoshii TaxID=79883 RepID=A0A5D4TDI4_9BACI|nr:hypothetical protein FZC75_09175 [Sutcliffiella horikoshii]
MEWKARRLPREEGTGETPQAQAEEAHGPPAGKRSAWNGDQPYITYLLLIIKKDTPHRMSLSLNQDYFLIRSLRLDCSIHSSSLSLSVLKPPGAASVWFFTTVA